MDLHVSMVRQARTRVQSYSGALPFFSDSNRSSERMKTVFLLVFLLIFLAACSSGMDSYTACQYDCIYIHCGGCGFFSCPDECQRLNHKVCFDECKGAK